MQDVPEEQDLWEVSDLLGVGSVSEVLDVNLRPALALREVQRGYFGGRLSVLVWRQWGSCSLRCFPIVSAAVPPQPSWITDIIVFV